MSAAQNNNPTWLKLIRALGAPIPAAPILQRASGAWQEDELTDLAYTYLGQGGFIDLTVPSLRQHGATQRHGLVVDTTGWTDLRSLDGLLALLQQQAAQLHANDRIVLFSAATGLGMKECDAVFAQWLAAVPPDAAPNGESV